MTRRAGVRALRAGFVAMALVACAATAQAQGVGINGTGAAADTSAILDLASTSKGLLVPRMTAAQRGAIVLPATGLVVYQTDGTAGLYYNAGTSASPNWLRVGANAVVGQWIASGSNLYYAAGKVAVGTTPGSYRFAVQDTGLVFRVQANNPNSVMASYGGYGSFQIDAPGTVAGRLSLLDSGYLGLGRTTPAARLDVFGGNWDVVNGEGDARIGDGTYRLKVGVATNGAGAGGVTLMQQGVAAGYNVLALGAQGNKVAYVNGNTSRFGIGTDVPNAPLGFPATTGRKIAFYPGGYGDYGFGIGSYQFQIYTELSTLAPTSVMTGTDSAGTFKEKFAFSSTGTMSVLGNAGSAGDVLQSGGSGAQVAWVSPTRAEYDNCYQATSQSSALLTSSSPVTAVPGLSKTFTVAGNAQVITSFSVYVSSPYCALCAGTTFTLGVFLDGGQRFCWQRHVPNNVADSFGNTVMIPVTAGTHTIDIRVVSLAGDDMNVGQGSGNCWDTLTLQVVPQ